MPEGDTLFRIAARLRPALQGHHLTRFEAPRLQGDRPALGELITLVEAQGKHLLIHFEDGLVLRTHLRMTGSWHVYREDERWQKGAHLARAVVGADTGWVAVCFQAPVVETYHRGGTEPDVLAALGPDLCLAASLADDVLDEVVERVTRLAAPGMTLGEALLDQRIAAGIGNVYKSEACFAAGLDPGTPIERVDADSRRRGLVGGGAAAPSERGARRAPHPSRRLGRLRPPWPALSSLRHPDPHDPPRGPGPQHVLVPHLPAPALTRTPLGSWDVASWSSRRNISGCLVKAFTKVGRLHTWQWSPGS